jgi:cyclopropane fatty-acyl-phospholipid synthase-like methyltransferase
MLRHLTFNLWYFRKPPWDSGISPPELHEFIRTHPAGRAIDLGCGTGTNVITLARAGWQVTGVDFAPRAIRIAGKKIKQAGIQADLRVGDVTKLKDISGPFDLALDIGCFHGLLQQGKQDYIAQLERILAPNGFWLVYGFFRPRPHHAPPGLVEADIDLISSRFTPSRAATAWTNVNVRLRGFCSKNHQRTPTSPDVGVTVIQSQRLWTPRNKNDITRNPHPHRYHRL